jgi:hypothetical protein
MSARLPNSLDLLDVDVPRTPDQDRWLADACQQTLSDYRAAVAVGSTSRVQRERARRAFLYLGGDPARASVSLKDYDHGRYGPFLGISDEGSAAGAIREAAYQSPKVRALPKNMCMPLNVGVAIDAERLGGIGEIAVGPDEYVDIWLECVDRLLITTNIGTRVNMRVYRREPLVVLKSDKPEALEAAKQEIAAAFKPFVETPDKKPRPLTVFVDLPRYAKMTVARKRAALAPLVEFVASGKAAGLGEKKAPEGQQLGLSVSVTLGPSGRDQAINAIELAATVKMRVVVIEGVKRELADRAISLAGLLEYFPPGLVGPILRAAKKNGVRVRAANLPDTETIARSTWVGLTTARSYGANLGKYGCFPLALEETDHVVQQIQNWLPYWSAAPVFFVDQGLLRDGAVDVAKDVPRGLKMWLETVARYGVRVVLIDTIDKANGKHLLKKSSKDDTGFLSLNQIKKVEDLARRLGIKMLWAGGLTLRDAYEMGKLGVFGIYVTSAASTTIPVAGTYVRDPMLAGLKEPSREAVLRTKTLLEAGFLAQALDKVSAMRIKHVANELLMAHDSMDATATAQHLSNLAQDCTTAWRTYWKQLDGRA